MLNAYENARPGNLQFSRAVSLKTELLIIMGEPFFLCVTVIWEGNLEMLEEVLQHI